MIVHGIAFLGIALILWALLVDRSWTGRRRKVIDKGLRAIERKRRWRGEH